MNIFGSLSLGFAVFVYLIPLQITLRQPIQPGHAGLGTAFALLAFMGLFWTSLLATWCGLVAQGGFSWMGGGRPWQFFAMFAGWLALIVVTTLSVFLRSETQLPTTLRPLMPWAIYVLPPIVLGATALLLNPEMIARPQFFTAGRFALGFCGAVTLVSATGIVVQYMVLRAREIDRVQRRDPAHREKNIRRIVREVEALDPQKDFRILLMHVGRDRFEEAREAARLKIASHPHLVEALAKMLVTDRSQLALEYLQSNTPDNPAPLAEPVRQALEGMAVWIRRKIGSAEPLRHDSFFNEIATALEVADKFSTVPDGDCRAAIRELRAAFESPKTPDTYVDAIRLLDNWLREHPDTGSRPTESSRPSLAHINAP